MLRYEHSWCSHLEKPRYAFVPKVMKAEISNVQPITVATPSRSDGIRLERKNEFTLPGHRQNDRHCFVRQVAQDVIALFLSWMLHVSDVSAPLIPQVMRLDCPSQIPVVPNARAAVHPAC